MDVIKRKCFGLLGNSINKPFISRSRDNSSKEIKKQIREVCNDLNLRSVGYWRSEILYYSILAARHPLSHQVLIFKDEVLASIKV